MESPLFDLSQNPMLINARGRLYSLKTPKLMGIVNLTPDSFSDGGKYFNKHGALKGALTLIEQGAEIIDLGPQSTRPTAKLLSAKEEIERLGNLINEVKKEHPEVLVSVDSFYSETIRYAFDQGLDIVNDISAGQFDSNLLPTVSELGLPYILMHVNPSYDSMHEKVSFKDITLEVNRFLLDKALKIQEMGINDIILDPGFGFGKSIEDQEKLLNEVEYLSFGQYPLLIGISRKSFIYKPLGKSPLEIDEPTQDRHLKVLRQGAKILRVHDIQSAKRTLDNYLKETGKANEIN